MAIRSFLYHHKILKFHKVKAAAKIWKVQIQLPCGLCFMENNRSVETINLTINEVLN